MQVNLWVPRIRFVAAYRWYERLIAAYGYASSLAAASLRVIGLRRATDLAGGLQAWRAAGLPVVRPAEPSRPRLAPH